MSRPARGAWVEIPLFWFYYEDPESRAPQGARGLKYELQKDMNKKEMVAPRKGRVG